MRIGRELLVGIATFGAVFALAVVLGQRSESATLRVLSVAGGLWAASAMAIFAGLAAHLAGRPAAYEPLQGESSAWGYSEYEEAGGEPPERRN